MAIGRTFDTGGSGGGPTIDPEQILKLLSGRVRMPGLAAGAAGNGIAAISGAPKITNAPTGGGGGTIQPTGLGAMAASNTGGGSGSAATGGGGSSTPTDMSTTSPEYLLAGADTFASNPEAMLMDMLSQQYGSGDIPYGLYEMLKPYADAANVLFLAQRGNSGDAEAGSKDDFLGYLKGYWDALQTPGARLDWSSALNNILNPAEGSDLENFLALGSPGQQAGNFLSLLSGVMDTSFHPLFAKATMNRAATEADRYLGASARGAVDPYYQWLQAEMPNLFPGM